MKNRYFNLIALTILIVTIVSLSVHAEKEHRSKKKMLPEAVTAAVQTQYPESIIEEVQTEREGIMLYEIEVKQGDAEYELSIAADGTIVEEEAEIDVADLPEAIQQVVAGTEVEEVKKEVTYWVVTLTKLDTPEVSYTVEFKQDGKSGELEFSADGTLLKQEMKSHDDDDDDDDDDD